MIPGGMYLGYDYQVALVDCAFLPSKTILSKGEPVGQYVYSSYSGDPLMKSLDTEGCDVISPELVLKNEYSKKNYTSVEEIINDYQYTAEWKLSLNTEKTNVIFTKNTEFTYCEFTFAPRISQMLGLDTAEYKTTIERHGIGSNYIIKFSIHNLRKLYHSKWKGVILEFAKDTNAGSCHRIDDYIWIFYEQTAAFFRNYVDLINSGEIVKNGSDYKVSDENFKSLQKREYKCDSVLPQVGNTEMFIYSNIVKNQYINDIQAPLLRKFPQEHEVRQRLYKTFASMYYMDVATPSLDFIHVYIMNECGREVPLAYEPFSCTLHFRKKK